MHASMGASGEGGWSAPPRPALYMRASRGAVRPTTRPAVPATTHHHHPDDPRTSPYPFGPLTSAVLGGPQPSSTTTSSSAAPPWCTSRLGRQQDGSHLVPWRDRVPPRRSPPSPPLTMSGPATDGTTAAPYRVVVGPVKMCHPRPP